MESEPLTITRTPGATADVTVDIGTLPSLPTNHQGYELVKSTDLPLYVLPEVRTLIGSRTQQVQDAIIAAMPGVNSASDVTEAHLAAITILNLQSKSITSLKSGDFEGLTSLEEMRLNSNQLTSLPEDVFSGLTLLTVLTLYGNQLTTLPPGIFNGLSSLATLRFGLNQLTTLPADLFDGLTSLTDLRMIGNQFSELPDGIFVGLTGLTTLSLESNAVDPLHLPVSLEKVGDGQFKAVAPTGAPFDIVVSIRVRNGEISGGATSLTIPAGSVESEVLTVTRAPGPSGAVSVWIGFFQNLPAQHTGYRLVKNTREFRALEIFEDISEQVWSGTVTAGTWLNDFGTAYIRGYGFSRHHNAGSVSNSTFTYRGTTYTIHGISMSRIGNNRPHRFSLVINPRFPECDEQLLELNGYRLSTPGGTNLGSWYLWRGEWAWAWPVGHTMTWKITLHPTVPDAPTVTATNEGNQVMLSWETPCDGGIDITGHEYRQRIGSGTLGPWIPIPNSAAGEANAISYTVLNVSNPLESTFEVRAVNELGVSLPSAETIPVSAGFVPVSERTPQVRDAIVAAVPGVNSAADVTETHLAAITSLNLRGKGITELKTGDFSGLTSLTNLNLRHNNITSLPSGIFDKLTTLTELNLDGNNLTSLPSGVFENNIALSELYLHSNEFTSFPRGIFDQLTTLTTLDCSFNDLANLRSGVFDNNTALTTLELDDNALTSLPSGIFDNLTSLTNLELSDNTLTTLPSGIFDNLTSLTNLYLSDTSISNISELDGLTSLTLLTLYNNSISDISALEDLTSLTFLRLDNTSISDISALEDLTALTRLFLSGNSISDYGPLRRLIAAIEADGRSLNLDITIPHLLAGRTPQVRDAIVRAVPGINSANDVTEAHLAAITSLRLSRFTNIRTLKAGDFDGLTALTTLDLSEKPVIYATRGDL